MKPTKLATAISVLSVASVTLAGVAGAAVTDRGYRVPVHAIDLEFIGNHILRAADNYAVCIRVDIDDITRFGRSTRQPLALTDSK